MPDGLSLDSDIGIISGIPKESGSYTFTVTAENKSGDKDSKEFTINVSYAYIIISGYVKDSNDNPIEGATVTLFDSDGVLEDTRTTDADGYYTFLDELSGEYFIKVNKENYLETQIKILIDSSYQYHLDDIILSSTLPNTYEITEGAGSVWQKGSLEGLKFVCNGEYDKFTGIMIDGQTISSDYYTAAKGSTILTLNTSYLETLSLGKHTLNINYQDGTAETTFTIQEASVNPSEPSQPENPQNGNDSNPQDSANTQNKTSQNENNSSVQPTDTPLTGDNSFIGFLIGLIGLSMAWAITNRFVCRKRSSK